MREEGKGPDVDVKAQEKSGPRREEDEVYNREK